MVVVLVGLGEVEIVPVDARPDIVDEELNMRLVTLSMFKVWIGGIGCGSRVVG